jgi:uncharacterized RDD family membrane protein YckC
MRIGRRRRCRRRPPQQRHGAGRLPLAHPRPPHAQPQPYAHQPHPPHAYPSPGPLAYGGAGIPGVAYAGWGQRFGAWIIDWLVLGVIRFILAMIMGMIIVAIEENSGEMSEKTSTAFGLGIIAVWYLCAWPYYALMEASRRRATLGKLALGIEVGDINGGPASFIQTSVRFLVRGVSGAILGIGFLMPLFTPRRQTLHDLAANMIVTVKPRPQVQGFMVHQPGAAPYPR